MDLTEDSEGAMAPAKQKVSGVKGALSAQEVLNHLKKEKQNARAWWWSKFEPEINENGACVVRCGDCKEELAVSNIVTGAALLPCISDPNPSRSPLVGPQTPKRHILACCN